MYNPNEPDLKTGALETYCGTLRTLNTAVINASIPYSEAMLSISIILIITIIILFSYAISTIIKQKKVSEMKNDFINNMLKELRLNYIKKAKKCVSI